MFDQMLKMTMLMMMIRREIICAIFDQEQLLPNAEEDEESKDKIFNQKANAEEDEERRHLPDS